MSRSGYSDECENVGLWRGAVRRAVRGQRGQALLRDMLAALDAMPQKKLIESALVTPTGECCALGSVALARKMNTSGIDAFDSDEVAEAFGIARALAAEIAYENDEGAGYRIDEDPEQRWTRMRAWVAGLLAGEEP